MRLIQGDPARGAEYLEHQALRSRENQYRGWREGWRDREPLLARPGCAVHPAHIQIVSGKEVFIETRHDGILRRENQTGLRKDGNLQSEGDESVGIYVIVTARMVDTIHHRNAC